MAIKRAVVDRSGIIDFIGPKARLLGRLPIARGEESVLRAAIEPIARHSYDGRYLIVGGCRDTSDDDEAYDALIEFRTRVGKALGTNELKRGD